MFPPPYSASPPPCRSLWLGFLLLHQRVSAGLLSLRGCAGVPEPEVEDSTSAIVVKNLMERYDGKEDGAFLSRQSSVFIQVPPPLHPAPAARTLPSPTDRSQLGLPADWYSAADLPPSAA